jgi:hypothetical protein
VDRHTSVLGLWVILLPAMFAVTFSPSVGTPGDDVIPSYRLGCVIGSCMELPCWKLGAWARPTAVLIWLAQYLWSVTTSRLTSSGQAIAANHAAATCWWLW